MSRCRPLGPIALGTQAAFVLAACASSPAPSPTPAPTRLTLVPDAAPAAVRAACALVERRCSRCHTIDRIRVAWVATPAQWALYVERMRRMPGSGIVEREAPTLVRCLVYRSFGAAVDLGG